MSLHTLESAAVPSATEAETFSMPEEDSFAKDIGKNLRELRKRRDLSLNDLAQLSGVSRSMLSQMETGRSIPSVLVLCKIARSLEVPVTFFLRLENDEQPSLISGEETPLRISAEGRCAWRTLWPEKREHKTEFYEITLRGGGIEHVPPYPPGVRANFALSQGSLCVALGGRRHWLSAGDVFEFAASMPHSYINPGSTEALAYLVLHHPQRLF